MDSSQRAWGKLRNIIRGQQVRDLIADFEHVDVDTSHPYAIMIRSPAKKKALETLLTRIDQRREAIQARRGLLDDSSALIREDREREGRSCTT